VADVEQKQRRRQAVGDAVQEVGGQQTTERAVAGQDRDALAPAEGRPQRPLRFRHRGDGDPDRERQQADQQPADHGHRRSLVRGQEGRQAGGDQRAEDHEAFARGGDAAALVVVAGYLGTPGAVGQQHQRRAEIDGDAPEQQVAGIGAGRRQEQAVGGEHQQRHPEKHPAAAPAERPAEAVGEGADQGIGRHVGEPGNQQQAADQGEAESEILGVEGRQIDEERQQHHRQRQPRKSIGQQPQTRKAAPGGGHRRHAPSASRCRARCSRSIRPTWNPASQ
jgi:hypothetical protein